MRKSWQAEREKGNKFAIQLLAWIALKLGRRVIFFLLCFIVAHYFIVAKQARQASREFLTRALGKPPRWQDIYRHLLTFAIVSVDRFFFIAKQEAIFNVEVQGNEIFSKYRQRGCFLITSHIGSFDALRIMGMGNRSNALPIRILLDIQHNANALAVIEALDPNLAKGIIDARTPGPELILILSEAIAQGELIGIMADRCTNSDRRVSLDFLGAPAQFPEGVWQLASLLEAPVISCVGIYNGGKNYRLFFELIAERIGTNRRDRTQAISNAMQTYKNILARYAGLYPYNWFNFFNFWPHESTQH